MSETIGTTSGGYAPAGGASTRDVAKEEAVGVATDAVQGGRQTAETAKQQTGEVVGEAMSQARALLAQTREQVTSQSSVQQEKAASGLHSLADELRGMVDGTGGQGGIASELVGEASQRIRSAASWLESRGPSEVLDDVRRFARQRPGTFLLSAAAVGFLGGRLTRGIAADARDTETSGSTSPSTLGAGYEGYGTSPVLASEPPLTGSDFPPAPLVEPVYTTPVSTGVEDTGDPYTRTDRI